MSFEARPLRRERPRPRRARRATRTETASSSPPSPSHDDDVERAVGRVATRLDRARHVLDPHHRSAHDRSEVVLDLVRAEAPSVGVDEGELERIVRVDLELDLRDLIAHRTERAEERATRDVVVRDELVDRERGRGVRLGLARAGTRRTRDGAALRAAIRDEN